MISIKKTVIDNQLAIYYLYNKVASITGGLARLKHEVNQNYIDSFLDKSFKQGLSLVALSDNHTVVGEIHAYTSGLYCFSHVWSELTIAVDPETQGQGVGRKLFEKLISEVQNNYPHVLRIELIARESNQKAITFYQSLGFVIDGEFKKRIKNTDGTFESDIAMAWMRNV